MPSRYWLLSAAFLGVSTPLSGAAVAASPDAWASFRKEVEASCLAASMPLVTRPQIVVDPFGSESYGLAFINGMAIEGGITRSLVCIYDKAAKTAEIGGTMALEQAVPALQPDATAAPHAAPAPSETQSPAVATAAPAKSGTESRPSAVPTPSATVAGAEQSAAAAALSERFLSPSAAPAIDAVPDEASALMPPPPPPPSAAPAPDPVETAAVAAPVPAVPGSPATPGSAGFAGQCDAACQTTLAGLAEDDRQNLSGLAAEVKRTVDRNAATTLGEGPARARDAALAAAASVEGAKLGAVAVPGASLVGTRSCVLYYFGYSGEASRTVGRHRCAVSDAGGGGLVVEKTSGERLRAEIRPLTPEVSAFVGRTYEGGRSETRYDAQNPVDSANSDLGNTVGFAAAGEGGIMLVSSQRRRFEGADDFFWVLAVDP